MGETLLPLVSPTTTTVLIAIVTNRVEISVTDTLKHGLPVNSRCAWQHSVGLAKHGLGCLSADGGAAKSYIDIWLCMKQAACKIDGASNQETTRTTMLRVARLDQFCF